MEAGAGSAPKVGVGIVVVKSGRVLLGKRKGAHGAGEWAFPGGKLAYGEELADCAARELEEETGLVAESFRTIPVTTNDIFWADGVHFLTVYLECAVGGEPELREPEKCEQWGWFDWDELPEPHFAAINQLRRHGYHPAGGQA
jgi:8-oxo-dGTP diphosphatase